MLYKYINGKKLLIDQRLVLFYKIIKVLENAQKTLSDTLT